MGRGWGGRPLGPPYINRSRRCIAYQLFVFPRRGFLHKYSHPALDVKHPKMVLAKSKNAVGLGNSLMNDRFGKGKGSDRKKVSAGVRRTDQDGQTVSTLLSVVDRYL